MFDCSSKNPLVSKGKLHQLIIEFGNVPNADIQYYEGYLDTEGNFVSLGVNKIHLQDREEEKDEDGNVIQEASTDFSDLLDLIHSTSNLEEDIEGFLVEKLQ